MCEPRWVGQVIGHLVSKCLSQVRLGVLPSLSPGTYTLKKPHGPAIYPTRAHSSRTVISLWLKVLRIHCEKPPKKKKKFNLCGEQAKPKREENLDPPIFPCFVSSVFIFNSDLISSKLWLPFLIFLVLKVSKLIPKKSNKLIN